MLSPDSGYTIPSEVGDSICPAVLRDHRNYLSKCLEDHAKGEFMHHEDVAYSIEIIKAMDQVIKYFGQ